MPEEKSFNRGFKGIWIPKEIWFDENLNPSEKILFAEVDSLDSDETRCIASDEYLMNMMQCSKPTLHRMLKKLKDLNYISVISFDGRKRVMGSNLKYIIQKESNDVSEVRTLGSRNQEGTLLENENDTLLERKAYRKATTTPEAAPSPEQNSSSSFSQEKQELVKDLPINQQTKINLMRFKLETIKAAIKNTSTASYDDYGAYIYNQAKNIEAGNYKERKHSEDYAESHKKRCIEEFGDRLTLPIRGGEKLKVTPYNNELELVVGVHAKIFNYASASFLHEVDKYFEKCGAAFRFNACGATP